MTTRSGGRRPLRWRIGLLAAGVVLIAVGVGLLAAEPIRLVLLDRAARYALFVLAAGFAVAAVAAATPAVGTALRWIAPTLLGVVALVAASLGLVVIGFDDSRAESVPARSADGHFELILVETHHVIDPVEELVLRSNQGPLSRQDVIGCFNLDASSRAFQSARFVGDRIEIVATSGESWTLAFDRDAVKMRDTLPSDSC